MRGDYPLSISKIATRLAFTNLIGGLRCDPCKGHQSKMEKRVAPLNSAAKVHHFSHPCKSRQKKHHSNNSHKWTKEQEQPIRLLLFVPYVDKKTAYRSKDPSNSKQVAYYEKNSTKNYITILSFYSSAICIK